MAKKEPVVARGTTGSLVLVVSVAALVCFAYF
mgnify:CR=1 FL=1